MNTAAVRHLSFYPFVQAVARDKIRFRLDAAAGDLTTCELVWWKRSTPEEKHVEPLTIRISSRSTDQWTCRVVFGEEVHYIKYGYRLTDASGKRVWYNAVGFHGEETEEGSFPDPFLDTGLHLLPDFSGPVCPGWKREGKL